MLSKACTACGQQFDEADRRWDEASRTGNCPFCGRTGTVTLAVPDGPAQFRKYQTAWRRFWAAFADGLLFLPLLPANAWIFTHVRSVPILVAWHIVQSLSFVVYSVL